MSHDSELQTEATIRAGLRDWLAANNPDMLARLTGDRYGERALTAAAQRILRNLERAKVVQADPTVAEPSRGDGFYLMDRPPGQTLQEALISLVGADEDYWQIQLRFLEATDDLSG